MSINWRKPLEWSTGEEASLAPYDNAYDGHRHVTGCEQWLSITGDNYVAVNAVTGQVLGCEDDYPHIRNVAPAMTQREETLCEAAMCMWEQALALFQTDTQWKGYVEGVGYAQARMDVVEHVPALQEAYEAVADTYDMCFDWDFVPDWMTNNLVITDQGLERTPS
jgi:hypothetical protein